MGLGKGGDEGVEGGEVRSGKGRVRWKIELENDKIEDSGVF